MIWSLIFLYTEEVENSEMDIEDAGMNDTSDETEERQKILK